MLKSSSINSSATSARNSWPAREQNHEIHVRDSVPESVRYSSAALESQHFFLCRFGTARSARDAQGGGCGYVPASSSSSSSGLSESCNGLSGSSAGRGGAEADSAGGAGAIVCVRRGVPGGLQCKRTKAGVADEKGRRRSGENKEGSVATARHGPLCMRRPFRAGTPIPPGPAAEDGGKGCMI